jgi:hypothetical protein
MQGDLINISTRGEFSLEDLPPWKVQGMQWRPNECRIAIGTKERLNIP